MIGTIETSLTPGFYLVRDQTGKKIRVSSAVLYRRGDRVTVLDGIIVGQAPREQTTRVYEV
jgi:hypothetical protein